MRARMKSTFGLSLLFLLILSLLGFPALAQQSESGSSEGLGGRSARPVLRTKQAAVQSVLQAPVSIDLCAKAGSITMPDGVIVPIWGFALRPAALPCSDPSVVAQVPGPVLDITVGDAVTLNISNELTSNVSLSVPGQGKVPDQTGAGSGGSASFTFVATNPGTYIYESGTDPSIQMLMGLYGALIVRPFASGQAYDSGGSAFDVESVIVLSEIDPAFNVNPLGFDLLEYSPTYWLINGQAYPSTASISANPGDRVLIRYINGGVIHHTINSLGVHYSVIAADAFLFPFAGELVGASVHAGSTLDAIVTVPLSAVSGDSIPLYSRHLRTSNAGLYPGGMVTYINVP